MLDLRHLLVHVPALVDVVLGKRAELVKAMETAKLDSPRGPLALTRSHAPIHDIYLRKVEGKENKVIGVAVKNMTDPPRGCKM